MASGCRNRGSPAHAGIDPIPHHALGRRPVGSPAHAGIDPAAVSASAATCSRFPRTRGDRPWRKAGYYLPVRWGSPAHAGIDPACHAGGPATKGSPAHAGIDRFVILALSLPQGFPRTRGDRPDWDVPPDGRLPRFPRTRGDRPPLRRHSQFPWPTMGSPAHAGIDRAGVALLPLGGGRGSPAHAGIDPVAGGGLPAAGVPPHTRG